MTEQMNTPHSPGLSDPDRPKVKVRREVITYLMCSDELCPDCNKRKSMDKAGIRVCQDCGTEFTLAKGETVIDRAVMAGDLNADRMIDAFLLAVLMQGGSDLHISAGSPPLMRHYGTLHKLDFPVITKNDSVQIVKELLTIEQMEKFEGDKSIDISYEIRTDDNVFRFRVNLYQQQRGFSGAFRVIPQRIPSFKELRLPPVVDSFTRLFSGLVLVTGPSGCGKTTTLAALIDYINETRSDHIITLEDPIEYVHKMKNCFVRQRAIGQHSRSFAASLRAAMREDPDIIQVGEMRDLETMQLAMTAAETGHLVLGTMPTTNAARTIDRIIDSFPPAQQPQVRIMLSESLKGIISQKLVRTVDGKQVPAVEIIVSTPSLAHLVRDQKTFKLPSLVQTSKHLGMQTLEDSLIILCKEGIISQREGRLAASDPVVFDEMLAGRKIEYKE
ncbi:MAG TPA: PilT/PilU family type 4a pilus ATPase [Candidatus Eremiobacteraeota bacterium]|nr:MAG: Twitching mobility protein [bacterium ADurb.Bin363]HPZ09998.1 PilT/PilU family type 4a pilus ATPase [Candidatus Eremiobacteraeota bacterium]